MVLKVYKMDASPPVRAVLMTLDQLNLPAEFVNISLLNDEHKTEEFLKLNPQHTIPVLVDDDFVLTDSHAIAGYLVSKYGKDDSLYPKDAKLRGIVDQRLHFDSGVLFPTIRAAVGPVIFLGAKEIEKEILGKIESGYDFMEKFLNGTWLAGDQFTIADICCVATISTMNEILPINTDKYPKLQSWLQRCAQLDIYKKNNAPGCKMLGDLVRSKLA